MSVSGSSLSPLKRSLSSSTDASPPKSLKATDSSEVVRHADGIQTDVFQSVASASSPMEEVQSANGIDLFPPPRVPSVNPRRRLFLDADQVENGNTPPAIPATGDSALPMTPGAPSSFTLPDDGGLTVSDLALVSPFVLRTRPSTLALTDGDDTAAAASSVSLLGEEEEFLPSSMGAPQGKPMPSTPKRQLQSATVQDAPNSADRFFERYAKRSPVRPFPIVFSPNKQAKIEALLTQQSASDEPEASTKARKAVEKKYKKESVYQPILDTYFQQSGATQHNKQLNIVVGLSGSGKSSTVVKAIQEQGEGAILVDSDKFKEMMDEFDEGRGAELVHLGSVKLADKCLTRAMSQGDNIIYTTVLTKDKGVRELIQKAKENGYTVKLHLAQIRPEEAALRMYNRGVNEHGFLCFSPSEILDVGHAPRDHFETLKNLTEVDQYSIWDTTVPGGKLRRQSSGRSTESSDSVSTNSGHSSGIVKLD